MGAMFERLNSIFFDSLKSYKGRVEEINKISYKEQDLRQKSEELRERVGQGENLDRILPEAFALVREAARRTLNQRHYDVQLMGGMVLHEGKVAQMMTGEGKTLAATAPVYLNALTGKGVHVVTVNEYLAKRDAVWMGQIYYQLGLKVACLVHEGALAYDPDYKISEVEREAMDKKRDELGSFLIQEDYLRPVTRREAYKADITYGTNHEFGFDYLRDNLAPKKEAQVQRPYYMAIIDEVDSILIDEARTPLIISAPDSESSQWYKQFARLVKTLEEGPDYAVDEKFKSVAITDEGIEKVERGVGVNNLYAPENLRLVHYLEESLKAKALFKLDKDYVVRNGEVVIVDEFTGRLMPGRRYNGGLHQAIEAKEGVNIKEESRTYAKVSIQNYFKMYPKLAGMTGTAETSREEFGQVYGLEVVKIPTHKNSHRTDRPDAIYRSFEAKMKAIVKRVKESNEKGQPILIGTTSIAKNELVSSYLNREHITHKVLNAKQHEQEGGVIAQAGRLGGVTVATNMAGRGVDIILGGNPPEEADKVRAAGGLLVIGTERHEARRIDDQLRGRSGRQGDQGESQFYLSLDDDLLRVFGSERIQGLLDRFDFPEDQPIDMKMVSRAVLSAQEKIEGLHFDSRKHLLQYDDVLNKQRMAVYRYRQEILNRASLGEVAQRLKDELLEHLEFFIGAIPSEIDRQEAEKLGKLIVATHVIGEDNLEGIAELIVESRRDELKKVIGDEIIKKVGEIEKDPFLTGRMLSIFDMLWMNHLEDMEALAESVRLRAYGQRDPLIEYRKEGHQLFERLFANFRGWLFDNIFRLSTSEGEPEAVAVNVPKAPEYKNVGRNDPCPCGSGKKYKKCHGK